MGEIQGGILMRSIKIDEEGVSPVIATILMIGITVVLAGSVFLISGYYTSLAEGEPEIFVVDVEIDPTGIEEIDSDGGSTGHTYSTLKISSTHKVINWEKYKVTIDGERVFTIPDSKITATNVPDASDDPAPVNSGKTLVGNDQYFTEESYRDDYRPLTQGTSYYVVVVNLDDNRVVWWGYVIAV